MNDANILNLLPLEKLKQFRHPSDPDDVNLIWRYRHHLGEISEVWTWINLIETALARRISQQLESKYGQGWLNSKDFRKTLGRDLDAFQVVKGKLKRNRLTFGFWTTLIQDNKEKALWVPTLNQAFVPGTNRKAIYKAAREIRLVRNKVAHHELLEEFQIESLRQAISSLAVALAPGFPEYIFFSTPKA
ncbi:MAG: hypothetical protein ACKOWR_04510 [Micrococcales bacterium]